MENDRLRKENLALQILADKDVMGKVIEHLNTPPPPPPTILSALVSYIRNYEENYGNHDSYQKYVNEFKENSYNFTSFDEFKEALDKVNNFVLAIYDDQHGQHNCEDLAPHILIMDLKDTFERIKNENPDWWDSLTELNNGREYGDTDDWVKYLYS